MDSPKAIRDLAIVRGWVRQTPDCDETQLSRSERECLAALRCMFAIIEQLQPVTVYGATYPQVYSALVAAQESLIEHQSTITLVEYNLAFQALMMAFERVVCVAKERGQ